MVVSSKGLLHILLIEQEHVLLDLFAVLVLPVAIGVVSVKIIFVRRDEGRFDSLVQQIIPWEISEPGMVFNIVWAIQAESIERLSLDESVYEVSCLNGPSWRNLIFLDLNLLGQNVLSYFSSVPASVGPASEHALVSNNSHGEIIDRHSMGLLAHDFRSHVTGCP